MSAVLGMPAAASGVSWRHHLAQRTFGSLDGLRALCILAVLWHHTHPGFAGPLGFISKRGFLGVELFFCISGYLIVTLVLREQHRTGGFSLQRFYIRRALRIFPLYYAVLLCIAVLAWASQGEQALQMRQEIGWAAIYVSNWVTLTTLLSITWSLSAEEQFYVVWPFLERQAGSMLMPLLGVALLLCASLQLAHAHFGAFAGMPEFLAQTSFVPILLGVALAHLLHGARGFTQVHRWLGGRGAAPIALVALIVLAAWPTADISGLPRLLITLAMVTLLAACVVREDHGLAPLLRQRHLAFVGTVSYGMYLLHMLMRHVAAKLLTKFGVVGEGRVDGLPLFVLTLLLTLGLAALSFRWFESYFLQLKHRLEAASRVVA